MDRLPTDIPSLPIAAERSAPDVARVPFEAGAFLTSRCTRAVLFLDAVTTRSPSLARPIHVDRTAAANVHEGPREVVTTSVLRERMHSSEQRHELDLPMRSGLGKDTREVSPAAAGAANRNRLLSKSDVEM